MRQAIIRAKYDKGVHQKSLRADSLSGAKEQRKLCGSLLLPVNVQPYNNRICYGCGQELQAPEFESVGYRDHGSQRKNNWTRAISNH